MPKNRVQFQKGFSLSEFMERYGSEDQCFKALYDWRWPDGFFCPKCSHTSSGLSTGIYFSVLGVIIKLL